jgi:hypothetical protein
MTARFRLNRRGMNEPSNYAERNRRCDSSVKGLSGSDVRLRPSPSQFQR